MLAQTRSTVDCEKLPVERVPARPVHVRGRVEEGAGRIGEVSGLVRAWGSGSSPTPAKPREECSERRRDPGRPPSCALRPEASRPDWRCGIGCPVWGLSTPCWCTLVCVGRAWPETPPIVVHYQHVQLVLSSMPSISMWLCSCSVGLVLPQKLTSLEIEKLSKC